MKFRCLQMYFLVILSFLTFFPVLVFILTGMKMLYREEEVNECNIPVLNPFDASIMPYYVKTKIQCRNPRVRLIKSDLEHIMLADEPYLKMNQLNCCYTPYLKMGDNVSHWKFVDVCVKIKGKVKAKDEFVRVQCKYGEYVIYSDYMDFVLRKKKFPSVKKDSNHLNVILFLLDGVSRMAFHRLLPETKKYLQKMGAVEFTKFTRVGENSFPNVMTLLTGNSDKSITRVDNCPFIWNTFAEKKFLTAYVEDAGYLDTFNFEKEGFQRQPVDYYWRPFNLLLEKIKDDARNAYTPFMKACVDDIPVHKRFLDYARKFFKRMTKDKQRFFAFFHSNSVSHDDNALLPSADEDFRDFFSELNKTGVLKNTILFFLSDHGARYGSIRQTHQGFFESNLPFFFTLLPEKFRNKYVSLYSIFKGNSDRLTTAFDIHETLKDIANLTFGKTVQDRSGISLFSQIPITRTCSQSGIPIEFCVCASSYMVVEDHKKDLIAGQAVVNHVNELVGSHRECASLSLNKVLDVRYVKYLSRYSILFQLKVMVSTKPGSGLFEAILQEVRDKYVVLGTVSRLSTYGKESSCMKNTTLKLYCYCQ